MFREFMTPIQIKKGLDIPLAGAPKTEVLDVPVAREVAVYQEVAGLKAKLLVKEGDTIKKGAGLFLNKKQPDLQFCSPVAGTVKAIEYGPRRALYRVVIDVADTPAAESFPRFSADQLLGADRDNVLAPLLASGLFALIQQRPFSRIADPAVTPKAIFVNGMNTAPFSPALNVVLAGQEAVFQAGLNALSRLTDGAVHLCLGTDAPVVAQNATNVQVHTFSGPHPAGNTSVHIHHIDPMQPTDQVWTVKAVDVIRIGKLLVDGAYPDRHLVSLAGPGVKEEARAYYRVQIGTPLTDFLAGKLIDAETRIIKGNALAGTAMKADEHVSALESALTVIPEGREQFFMGWMAPGINKLSASRAYLSGWTGHKRKWNLTTTLNGSYRSMVLTGLYDKYMPMNIMVDYLVRAVLAHDTDEAIKLGILETDPEDFALCSYVCPSKMDISGVIRQGLEEIEKEGI
jgi:Na+-transporting NADH:ubiquinone oxidoreductase subunit A